MTDRHGTLPGYVVDKCRCRPCKDAMSRYERGRQWDRDQGRPRMVPAIGVQRRIQALRWMGWSNVRIAAELNPPTCGEVVWCWLTKPMVHHTTHEKVAEAYERLSMRGPEVRNSGDMVAIAKAKAEARRKGWAPPLAWDDIDHDESPAGVADAADSLDPVAIQRRIDGDRTVPLTNEEQAEAWRIWEARGGTWSEFERRTGINITRARKAAQEAA